MKKLVIALLLSVFAIGTIAYASSTDGYGRGYKYGRGQYGRGQYGQGQYGQGHMAKVI